MESFVTVAQGRLRGCQKDGVLAFLGIPYARPPVDELRFAAPVLASSWSGVRDAVDYGPTAPAPGYSPPIDLLLPEPVIPGDDFLNLNVWAPSGGRGRPVLVWIHGGAFVNGSGAVSVYDGSAFARDGIVCVTFNYRLGLYGFGAIEGAPHNRGLLDQIAALTWVRDNIAAFGGDPELVTVAGESAGAMSIGALLTMPAAEGLFRRAVLQSGAGHHVLRQSTASAVSREVASVLGVPATVAGLSGVPIDELISAQASVAAAIATTPDPGRWAEITVNAMAFEPVVDGATLPARPIDAIAGGAGAGVDVLIGTTSDEFGLFLVPTGVVARLDERFLRMAVSALGADVGSLLDGYRKTHPHASPGELLTIIMTDWFFRIPAVRVAEARLAHGAATHVYEFAWDSPQFDGALGACHALEVGFVFDHVDDPATEPLAGTHPPRSLAREMHAAWVAFARDGSPGWPAYGAGRTVMVFDQTSALVTDPSAADRERWEGIR